MSVSTGLTIEDFEKLPDALALNHELVEGELVDVSGNICAHIQLRDYLAAKLLLFVRERKLGKVFCEQEFQFDESAHGPDVSFIGPDKLHLLERRRRVQMFVPDLVIEIAGIGDRFDDMLKKVERYRRSGTLETWVFSIETRTAFLFSAGREAILHDNDTFSSPLIPGFSIRLGELFDRAAE